MNVFGQSLHILYPNGIFLQLSMQVFLSAIHIPEHIVV